MLGFRAMQWGFFIDKLHSHLFTLHQIIALLKLNCGSWVRWRLTSLPSTVFNNDVGVLSRMKVVEN